MPTHLNGRVVAPPAGDEQSRPDLSQPIAWYVHLPFCHSKCGYCDFYSLPTRPEWVENLVRAVCLEIRERDPGRPVRSIFVGGGTPTVLPATALETILRAIPTPPHAGVEFTVEANPSSADELKLDLLRRCGVNRVSFGAQSFHRDELAVLERLHDPAHIPEAVAFARRAGFENVNLDLIFGVPGQTVERWIDSLRRAVALNVEHISCYSLMFEEGTALTKRRRLGQIAAIDEELEAEMYERTIDELTAAGYEHYEISNFARPGRRCDHNMVYWLNEEYVGIGPSAVSYERGERRKNVADVQRYVADILRAEKARPRVTEARRHGGVEGTEGRMDDGTKKPGNTGVPPGARLAERDTGLALLGESVGVVVEREQLDAESTARETAIQMLRLTDGIDVAAFERRTGFDPRQMFAVVLERFAAGGQLACDNGRIRLTRRGLPVANHVMREFLA